MATIPLNIADDQLARVVDALCGAGHYDPASGLTKAQFAKAEAARIIRERVLAYERRAVLDTAAESADGLSEPQVE